MGQSRLHAAKTTRGPSDTRALREEKLKPVMGSCSSTNLTLYRPQDKKVVLGHCQNQVSQSPWTKCKKSTFFAIWGWFFHCPTPSPGLIAFKVTELKGVFARLFFSVQTTPGHCIKDKKNGYVQISDFGLCNIFQTHWLVHLPPNHAPMPLFQAS